MIPFRLNPMAIQDPIKLLLDNNTKFLIYGSLQDRAGNVQISNSGLLTDGSYIYTSSQTSYAKIPANTLPQDVMGTSNSWCFQLCFYIPQGWSTGISRRVGIFGTTLARFDVLLFPIGTGRIGIGGMISGLGGGYFNFNGDNLFKVNFQPSLGYSFTLNGIQEAGAPEDTTTPRNIRAYALGLLANLTTPGIDSYAHMIKIKYIRMSNCIR